MAHAENEIVIKKSATEIFDFVADGLNNPKWRQGVITIELRTGLAGQVGAEYRQQLKGPGGREIAGDYRITKSEPGRELDFAVIAGPARPVGSYIMESTSDGTKLKFVLDFSPKGLMKLMAPMIQKTMESEVGQLAALKALLDQRVSSTEQSI